MSVRELEWRAYAVKPQPEFFELEEEDVRVFAARPRYEVVRDAYTLDTYDRLVRPMKRLYDAVAEVARKVAERHGIHSRLVSVLVSVAVAATGRYGAAACLRKMHPVDYVKRYVVEKRCSVFFFGTDVCRDLAEGLDPVLREIYAYWSPDVCGRVL
jgi:predicted Ser/Thr protein kinase